MNVRSLVSLLLILALVTASVWVAQLNRQAVTVTVPGLAPFSAPLWAVLFLTLLSGIFVALVYSLAMTSREAMDRWRSERSERPQRERAARLESGLRALAAGDAARAREELEAVAREQPGSADAWLFAGTAARRSGDPDAAHELHLRALGLLADDPRVLEELSRDAEEAGDWSRAVRYQQRLMEAAGATPERQRRVRDLHLRAGAVEAAITAQTAVLESSPEERRDPEGSLLRAMKSDRGRRALANGEPEQAAAEARALLDQDAAYEPAHALLVDALLEGAEPEQALEAYRNAFAATRSLEMLRRHANLLVDTEEPEEAIRLLRDAVAELEGARRNAARILLGRLYYRLELVDEALTEFEELREEVDSSPLVDYYLAKLRARRGEHEAANDLLKSSVRSSGFLDVTYRCLACGTVGPQYAVRCSESCPCGTVEMEVGRHARPVHPVEAPAV